MDAFAACYIRPEADRGEAMRLLERLAERLGMQGPPDVDDDGRFRLRHPTGKVRDILDDLDPRVDSVAQRAAPASLEPHRPDPQPAVLGRHRTGRRL